MQTLLPAANVDLLSDKGMVGPLQVLQQKEPPQGSRENYCNLEEKRTR